MIKAVNQPSPEITSFELPTLVSIYVLYVNLDLGSGGVLASMWYLQIPPSVQVDTVGDTCLTIWR